MPRRNRLTPLGELLAVPDRGTLWGNRGQLLDRHGALARHHSTKAWIVCVLEFKGWQRTQWQPGRLTELYLLDEATGLAAGHRPCGLCRRADHDAFKAAYAAAFPGTDASAPGIDAVLHDERLVPAARRRSTAERPGGRDGVGEAVAGGRVGPRRVVVGGAGPPGRARDGQWRDPPGRAGDGRRRDPAGRAGDGRRRDPAGPGWQRTHAAAGRDLPTGAMVALDGAPWLVRGGRLSRWTPGGYTDGRPVPRGTVTLLTPPATVAVLRAGFVPRLHPSAS